MFKMVKVCKSPRVTPARLLILKERGFVHPPGYLVDFTDQSRNPFILLYFISRHTDLRIPTTGASPTWGVAGVGE